MPLLPGYQPKSDLSSSETPTDSALPPRGSEAAPQDPAAFQIQDLLERYAELKAQTAPPSEIPDLIEKLSALKEKNILSVEEFENAKAGLLSQITS